MKHISLLTSGILALASSVVRASPRGVERSTILAHPRDVEESYDYIIVGGGTSGLTVADRLTEDGKTTVLVIEYGEIENDPVLSNVSAWRQVQTSEMQYFYNITSVPQPGMRNRTNPVLVGKLVGGGSAVNAMMTLRGYRQDYDQWGAFFHNRGASSTWSWDGMMPYFKRAVNFVPPEATMAANIRYDASLWGNTSGVYASFPPYQFPGTLAQVETWKGMPGVEFPPDSGAGLPGVYWYPTFMDPSTRARSFARTGHYENVKRSNYHLLTGSKVNKILLNGTTAYGVSFVSVADGKRPALSVRATKEVILAAGAIHTPQIMQLSGLGPKALLESANIPTLVDLPGVGQNFQDHPIMSPNFTYRSFDFTPSSASLEENATFRAWAEEAWETNRTGPYSIATGNVAAWLSFPVISQRWEKIATELAKQDHAALLPLGTHPTVVAGYRAQMLAMVDSLRGNKTTVYNLILAGGAESSLIVYLHALSRGTVNIDPEDPEGREPIVDYRVMSNPLDGAIMADMLRYTRRYYLENPASAKYDAVEVTPGANLTTDADLVSYLADTMGPSLFHPSGTCAMMPKELGGVVDQELRVYGVGNLRIIDASIMPMVVGGNTCQPVYAIAEKAADLIRTQKSA